MFTLVPGAISFPLEAGTVMGRQSQKEPVGGTVVALPGECTTKTEVLGTSTHSEWYEERRYLGFITGKDGYVSANCERFYLIANLRITTDCRWYTSDGKLHASHAEELRDVKTYIGQECHPTFAGALFGWSGNEGGVSPGLGWNSLTGAYGSLGGNNVDISDPTTWVGSSGKTTIGELKLPDKGDSTYSSSPDSSSSGDEEFLAERIGLNETVDTPPRSSEGIVMYSGVSFGVTLPRPATSKESIEDFLVSVGGAQYVGDVLDTSPRLSSSQLTAFLEVYGWALTIDARQYISNVIDQLNTAYPPGTYVIVTIRDSKSSQPGVINY